MSNQNARCLNCGCEIDSDTGRCPGCGMQWATEDATDEDADQDENVLASAPSGRYALVKIDGYELCYIQETDEDGDLVSLLDAEGDVVNLGECEWTVLRDLGPVTGDVEDFQDIVASCPEFALE